ncbi:TPA: hypothetical protein P0E21_004190 [Vibrio harveyi]|nr:hypothetical protein [Vibrio harveyi]HDM8150555.1 hypothetical protein [Vibrio harveyi]HDM8193168.1 hypothetical protein [Vibrio harveyi]
MLPRVNMVKKLKLTTNEIVDAMVASVCEMSDAEQVWRVLIDPSKHSEYDTQFNMYSALFVSISRSSYSTLLMGLSRVSDDQKNSVNILRLLDLVEAQIGEDLTQELREKYSSCDDVWVNIKHPRHNVYAHISGNTTELSAYERAGITPNDLTKASNVAKEIVLTIYESLGGNASNYRHAHFDARHDLDKLFRNLKAGREARFATIKA